MVYLVFAVTVSAIFKFQGMSWTSFNNLTPHNYSCSTIEKKRKVQRVSLWSDFESNVIKKLLRHCVLHFIFRKLLLNGKTKPKYSFLNTQKNFAAIFEASWLFSGNSFSHSQYSRDLLTTIVLDDYGFLLFTSLPWIEKMICFKKL